MYKSRKILSDLHDDEYKFILNPPFISHPFLQYVRREAEL